MNINFVINNNKDPITYEDFIIMRYGKTRKIGNGKYIYCIEEITRIIDKKINVVIKCFYNPYKNETIDTNEYIGLFNITKLKKINEKYGIYKYQMIFKNINTNEEKSLIVEYKKIIKNIKGGYCPDYAYIMCGNFPVIQEIKSEKEQKFDYQFYNDMLIIITDIGIKEINCATLDNNLKDYLEKNNTIYITSYYSSYLFSEILVMELVTKVEYITI